MDYQIFQTTDYNKFKFLNGNRPVSKGRVRVLTQSILENNLLPTNPIKVDQNFQIIDGQHRLKAAKELGIPIYYTFFNGNVEDVGRLNLQWAWSMEDFLNLFIAKGNEHYKLLKTYCDNYKIGISPMIILLGGTSINVHAHALLQGYKSKSSELFSSFKKGNFKIDENILPKINKYLDNLISLRPYTIGVTNSERSFLRAVEILFQNEQIKISEVIHKIQNSGLKIYKSNSTKDYLIQFENIYNYRRKIKDRIPIYNLKTAPLD